MRFASGFSVVVLVALVSLGAVLPSTRLHAAPPGLLDGQSYTGVVGPKKRAGDRADTLHFAGGRCWTHECGPCGFVEALYSGTRAGDALPCQGVLPRAEGARFAYVGVLRNGQLTATMLWHKARWYWRIERDFHFQGAREAMRVAAAGGVAVSSWDRRCAL